MKNYTELNHGDIVQIIADHLDVDTNKVCLYTSEEIVGYGMGEHLERVITARVEMSINDRR